MFRSLGGVMCKFWGFSLSLHTCIQGNVCPGSYQWVIFEQFHCYRIIFNLLHGSIPILHGGQKWNDNGTESICFLTWNPVCDAAVCYLTRIWLDINFPPNLPQHSVSYMCGWLLAEHFLHSPGLCSTLTRFSYISLSLCFTVWARVRGLSRYTSSYHNLCWRWTNVRLVTKTIFQISCKLLHPFTLWAAHFQV